MPKYEINLSDELVEGIKEMIIKEDFPVNPNDVPGFLEWLMENNIESRARERQVQRLSGLKSKEIKEALDDFETKKEEK